MVLYNLGLALSDSGQFDKAEQHLRRAVEVDSENINAQVALGVALFRQERYVDAVAVLQEAVALEPTNPWAQRNLGGCFLKLGQIAEAEPCLRLAAELNPSDQQSLFGYAQVLHMKGEGQFSGLNLVCLMYVAFKHIAPQQDMSFDLAKEFEVATTMHKKGK